MAREKFQNLTEPMYYVLLALTKEWCGVDIMEKVTQISHGRVKIGPGTLYTLLAKFEEDKFIRQTKVEGRKRWYIITDKGRELLQEEYVRLQTLVKEGKAYLED